MRERLIVLKFGGSVLTDELRLRIAVHEIYRWRREGWRVLAVVSAFAGRTDELLESCRLGEIEANAYTTAAIASCGERESAAKLLACLDRVGVPATLLDPAAFGFLAHGPVLDAHPLGFDASRVTQALDSTGVVVVPGFFAVDSAGRTVTLGRGGSDLTALVLADGLRAERCRLVKDVDGLYERDPASSGPRPQRFQRASYGDVLELDGSIVQHKAVRFARERGVTFELGSANSQDVTIVGAQNSVLSRHPRGFRPLRVALLGHGVVGGGVLELLTQMPDRFEVVAAAVRDVAMHEAELLRNGVREISTDPVRVAECGVDVVVEALGGSATARAAVCAALRSNAHVVTANKAMLAEHGRELLALAKARGRELRYSASVGGSAPVIEAAGRLGARGVRGVLNGTSNFVLSRVASGSSLEEAVGTAQRLGLAEADPSRDLDGRDAMDKLRVICLALGVDCGRCDLSRGHVALARPGLPLRQIATLHESGDLEVSLEPMHPDDALDDVSDEWNAAEIVEGGGRSVVVRGRGAGRWPTAEAVVADLLSIHRQVASRRMARDSTPPSARQIQCVGDGVPAGSLEKRA